MLQESFICTKPYPFLQSDQHMRQNPISCLYFPSLALAMLKYFPWYKSYSYIFHPLPNICHRLSSCVSSVYIFSHRPILLTSLSSSYLFQYFPFFAVILFIPLYIPLKVYVLLSCLFYLFLHVPLFTLSFKLSPFTLKSLLPFSLFSFSLNHLSPRPLILVFLPPHSFTCLPLQPLLWNVRCSNQTVLSPTPLFSLMLMAVNFSVECLGIIYDHSNISHVVVFSLCLFLFLLFVNHYSY